jgi:hypothetical protein
MTRKVGYGSGPYHSGSTTLVQLLYYLTLLVQNIAFLQIFFLPLSRFLACVILYFLHSLL